MRVVFPADHAQHSPKLYFKGGGFVPPPEVPDRAEQIAAQLRKDGGHQIEAPIDHGAGPRGAVHTPEYLIFLETVHDRWVAMGAETEEVLPNIHPGRHMATRPDGLLGQIGWHTADMSSPIGPHTWAAACDSANAALTAANIVMGGEREAYALCRPPGHHVYADMAGGFCFLNNVAIAAQHARDKGLRPAIVDIDVHAGNGTQGIFYRRPDVLTVSLHCDPIDFYPFFAGHAHERGEGDGAGAHLNLPLAKGTGDNAYLDVLAGGLERIKAFGPDILFVAMGLDTYEGDPFEAFNITTPGFARIARALAELGLPTVLVQEGGYNVADLGMNVASFLDGFMSGRD